MEASTYFMGSTYGEANIQNLTGGHQHAFGAARAETLGTNYDGKPVHHMGLTLSFSSQTPTPNQAVIDKAVAAISSALEKAHALPLVVPSCQSTQQSPREDCISFHTDVTLRLALGTHSDIREIAQNTMKILQGIVPTSRDMQLVNEVARVLKSAKASVPIPS